MAEDFLGRPSVGGVAEVAVSVVAAGEEDQRLPALRLESSEDIGSGN